MSIKPVDCPLFWSADQAASVIDYLDRITDAIWKTYGNDIIELRAAELDEEEGGPPSDQYRFEFGRDQSDDFEKDYCRFIF